MCSNPDCPAAATDGTDTTTGSSSSTTGEDNPTDGIQTVTGDDTTAAPGSSTSTGSTSGPAAEPEIVDIVFDPDPLEHAGVIHVDVTATSTNAVEMMLKDGPIGLTPAPGGHFVGEIEVLSGLQNGEHEAGFTAQGEGGEAAQIGIYHVALSTPGKEAGWDASPDVGLGEVRAVRVTSTNVLEFGTHQVMGESRCYLRRRDLVGVYADADIMEVEPGKRCVATDLVVGPADEVYFLADVTVDGKTRWRLGELTAWGVTAKLDEGALGEVATALTLGAGGELVACGSAPGGNKDRDARYWLRYPGGFGQTGSFDYWPDLKWPHTFSETIRDCEFAEEEKLVMVGESLGVHDLDPNDPVRRRMALLEIDLDTDEHVWTVADIGPNKSSTQSAGTALAIDDVGDYIVGLYTCGDQCDPAGEFRVYEPGGVLAETPLIFADEIIPPVAVAHSPAGYIVVASAQGSGFQTKFLVQTYARGKPLPLWTYTAAEGVGPNLAETLAFVPGVVVAGGLSGLGYPALAFIYG